MLEYSLLDIIPIVLFPFSAFLINAFFGRKLPRSGDWISVLGIFLSFLWCFRIFIDVINVHHATDFYVHKYFTWFDLNGAGLNFKVDMGIYIDNMSAVMLLMVSGAATLIHLFSTYYMKGDKKYGKFFVFLSLFTSAMLGLVLSDNLLSVFIFWEIMGFCSYSLIGFYHEKEAAGSASVKAFMTTRVGDVCFLLGILGIWVVVGNVSFVDLYAALDKGLFSNIMFVGLPALTFIGICLFLGTVGKSAQFPLQIWLPDAMMGPTPCSALIHAATMVAAGVYLGLRAYPVLMMGDILWVVAGVGAITAFGAATIALVQTDIKAVLAFSTISQLGYMVMGLGVESYNASFMHLITHAVFKACLFLSAGSVIHSLHDHHTHEHVQEMPRMGGLKSKMKYTHLAMLFCSLAIAGVPLFSGFVSKDRILGDALYWGLSKGGAYLVVPMLGFAAAFLTAFYMFRMMFLTFYGSPRDREVFEHCHEEKLSFNRNIPLLTLTVFTLGVWYSGSLTGLGKVSLFPEGGKEWFKTLIVSPKVGNFNSYSKTTFSESTSLKFDRSVYVEHHGNDEQSHLLHTAHVYGAVISIIIAFSGIGLAYLFYIKKSFDPSKIVNRVPGFVTALKNRYYFDNLYVDILIKKVLFRFNSFLAYIDLGIYDRFAIDGWKNVQLTLSKFSSLVDTKIVDNIFVDGLGFITRFLNALLKTFQNGRIQFYISVMIIFLGVYYLVLLV